MARPSDHADWLQRFKTNALWTGLNPAQQAAVALPNAHALILAGAGTGKTKTLVARIAALLQDGGVAAREILAVTFTNKAAKEMNERVAKAVGDLGRGLTVGTFHGVMYRWIRHDWEGFGYRPNATILDSDDQKALMKRLYKDQNWDDSTFPVKETIAFINDQKEQGLRPTDVVIPPGKSRVPLQMYSAYQKRLTEENALDFAELLMAVRDRLRDDPAYFDATSGRWATVLVDEFQDTNPLQYDLLERLVKKGGAIFAVGDDDQCLATDTRITLADGTQQVLASVQAGVTLRGLAPVGQAQPFGAYPVLEAVNRTARRGLVTLRYQINGRPEHLTSTPEHTHFVRRAPAPIGPWALLTLCRNPVGPSHRLVTHGVPMETWDDALTRLPATNRPAFCVSGMAEDSDTARLWSLANHLRGAHQVVLEVAVIDRNGQPWYGHDARNLMVGDELLAADGRTPVPILTIDRTPGPSLMGTDEGAPVRDINVQDAHHFIANGVVTHNSIYGFRGARVENVFDFEKNYAGPRVVRLEENYRSTGNILAAANAVIGQGTNRMGKRLWTAQQAGPLVRVRKVDSEAEEATETVDDIAQAINRGVAPVEIAVLYRSNAQSRVLEQAFLRRRLPYKIVGGLRFFERAEIKDALAHARVLICPDDVGAFHRAVAKPSQGIGPKRIDAWRKEAESKRIGLFEAIKHAAFPGHGKPDQVAINWVTHIERGQGRLRSLGLAQGFAAWMDDIGLREAYATDEKAEERLDNLNEFVNAIGEFEQNGGKDLAVFVADAVLDSGEAGDAEGVQLSTVHAAKGLEFECVFWVGLEEGLAPNGRALAEAGGEDEERRLAYVAITRAKQHLTLSFASQRFMQGNRLESEPSRYLSEIDPALLQPVNTRWPPEPRPAGWDFRPQPGQPRKTAPASNSTGVPLAALAGTASPASGASRASRPAPTRTAPPAAPASAWEVRDKVRHPRFGIGRITAIGGLGDLEELKVKFNDGERRLIARFSQLTKVPE